MVLIKGISPSYFLSKKKALQAFPMIEPDKISGAIVYYDGAHNDSRMNIALAMTAKEHGASVCNHVEVIELMKEKQEGKADQICGAICRDTLTGDVFQVKAKGNYLAILS